MDNEVLIIPLSEKEFWDEDKEVFITIPAQKLFLKHSLLSISKWESKYKKSFLHTENFSNKELLYYIKCMTLNNLSDDLAYMALSATDIQKVKDYINDPMTATTIKKSPGKKDRTILTNEVIYGYMVNLRIPFSCEKWHLNRLLTLIQVCNEQNKAPSKMDKMEALERRKALNAQRKAKSHSKG